MEGTCDIGGPKYPWPAVNRKMTSSRVGLSPRCHRMIELGDDPRIIVLTRHHEWLQIVSLYEENGVSEPRVRDKCREIVVHLPMEISIPVANIPRDGDVMSLKVIHFQSIFSDLFLSKKNDLYAEIWNN